MGRLKSLLTCETMGRFYDLTASLSSASPKAYSFRQYYHCAGQPLAFQEGMAGNRESPRNRKHSDLPPT
jgi:hypothetical protein